VSDPDGAAAEHLAAGRVSEALAEQIEVVRGRPLDADARYLLFQLFTLTGAWERAAKQLAALARLDPELQRGVAMYRSLLAAEVEREAVFAGTTDPILPPEPPAHARLRLEALQAAAAGDPGTAAQRVAAARDERPIVKGTCNGETFTGLADADELLASLLEVFAGGRYLWLPLEHIARLTATAPRHLLETVWLPAQLEYADGEAATVHLPALYPGSAGADDAVRLGRETRWRELAPGVLAGGGLRLLVLGSGDESQEVPILELRDLAIAGD
jgi:type VI secretion system protein ImpE